MTRRLEYMPLTDVTPAARNPKRHHGAAIADSVSRFGYVEPMVLDDRTGHLVAGHGRLADLARRKEAGETPPEGVRADGDDWLVPVLRGWASNSDAEAEAYLVASNRLVELGGWDPGDLQALLADLPADLASLTGWEQADLDALIEQMEKDGRRNRPRNTDSDDAPESAPPITKPGDLWLLGPHRLLCGDASNADDVARLRDGAKPRLMITDPPYGVNYDPEWRDDAGLSETARGKVSNDDTVDWTAAWLLSPADVAYVWHASWFIADVLTQLADASYAARNLLVWAKENFAISRGHYHWQHEPCWYAVRKGGKARWVGDRSQSTLWRITRSESSGATAHGTQKPVECMARPLRNHEGDVYDPFMGSGTTIIAAHQEGRTAYGMDIDPAYVDIACLRWQQHTGEKPIRESTGEVVDFDTS